MELNFGNTNYLGSTKLPPGTIHPPTTVITLDLTADELGDSTSQAPGANPSPNGAPPVFLGSPNIPILQQAAIILAPFQQQAIANKLQFSQTFLNEVFQSTGSTITPSSTTTTNEDDTGGVVDTSSSGDSEIDSYASAQTPPLSPKALYATIQTKISASVEEQISQQPEADQPELLYAYMNPEALPDLSEELQNTLKGFIQTATNAEITQYNFSPTWAGIPPDATSFNAELTTAYDDAFSSAVQDLLNSTPPVITQEQANELTTMHYLPGTVTNATPDMQALFNNLETMVTNQIQQQLGIGFALTLTPDTAYYNNVLNGNFLQAFEKLIKSNTEGSLSAANQALLEEYMENPNDPAVLAAFAQNPGLKAQFDSIIQQQTAIRQSYANPDDPSIDPDVKALTASITQQATASTIAKYGLSATWVSTLTSLEPEDGMSTQELSAPLAALDIATGIQTSLKSLVAIMPNGSAKSGYFNYLQTIATAIGVLQNSIQALQVSRSKMQGVLDNLTTEMNQTTNDMNIATRNKINDENSHRSKGSIMDVFSAIGEWFGKICMIAMSAAVPFLTPLVVAYVVEDQVNQDKVQKALSSVSDQLGVGGPFVALGIGYVTMNPMLAMQLMSDSNAMSTAIKRAGGSDTQAEMGSMIFNATVEIIMMIAMIVASCISLQFETLPSEGLVIGADATELGAGTANLAVQGTNLGARALDVTTESTDIAAEATEVSEIGAQLLAESSTDEEDVAAGIQLQTAGETATEETTDATNIASKVAKVGNTARYINNMSRGISYVNEVMNFTFGGMQATADGMQMNDMLIQAEVTVLQAQFDAYNENVTAVIQMIQKLIALLLANVQAGGTDVNTMTSAIGSLFSDASGQVTSLTRTSTGA